eukprot:gnl/TRDRNA2_/TRDRNA2_175306_c0_seq1.p1 gnl/TRDRNA2_/TRDRNA2_175306_c0~~gnl/TRDRNA2_/TRDRNA2_175306_c0_seq1.p1  ORF type:complete len:151 (+),score=11.65 gnl/TRDRNA2_/TRDRNA2_175306_c0_seq1:831-1283(+)
MTHTAVATSTLLGRRFPCSQQNCLGDYCMFLPKLHGSKGGSSSWITAASRLLHNANKQDPDWTENRAVLDSWLKGLPGPPSMSVDATRQERLWEVEHVPYAPWDKQIWCQHEKRNFLALSEMMSIDVVGPGRARQVQRLLRTVKQFFRSK